MNDHERRRLEDTSLGKVIYFWPLIVGALAVAASLGGYVVVIRSLGNESEHFEMFQSSQQSINARLATLLETHDNRIKSLEDWRNRSDRWNQ
jgi:hypothetical protein